MRDAKVSHNWGTNIVIIQGNGIIGTIPITNKLGIQAKRPKVLICCDFHYGISNDEEDVMFAIELNMFSIGTITIPIHIKHVHKLVLHTRYYHGRTNHKTTYSTNRCISCGIHYTT